MNASSPQDAHVELRKVSIGRDFGSTIEIMSGLSAGDAIVTSPPDYLVDGMQVTIQPPAGQQAATGTKS